MGVGGKGTKRINDTISDDEPTAVGRPPTDDSPTVRSTTSDVVGVGVKQAMQGREVEEDENPTIHSREEPTVSVTIDRPFGGMFEKEEEGTVPGAVALLVDVAAPSAREEHTRRMAAPILQQRPVDFSMQTTVDAAQTRPLEFSPTPIVNPNPNPNPNPTPPPPAPVSSDPMWDELPYEVPGVGGSRKMLRGIVIALLSAGAVVGLGAFGMRFLSNSKVSTPSEETPAATTTTQQVPPPPPPLASAPPTPPPTPPATTSATSAAAPSPPPIASSASPPPPVAVVTSSPPTPPPPPPPIAAATPTHAPHPPVAVATPVVRNTPPPHPPAPAAQPPRPPAPAKTGGGIVRDTPF